MKYECVCGYVYEGPQPPEYRGDIPVRGIPAGSRGAGAHAARYRVYRIEGGKIVGEEARTYSPESGKFA